MTAPRSTSDPQLRELSARARTGDPAALGALVTACWQQLKQWALWEVGDTALADDACQEAALRLMRSAHALDPERNVSGWLRAVVRNVCRDLLATERRMQRPLREVASDPAPTPERELDVRRGAERMVASFAALTPRQREALDLVDRCGLSPSEAAEQMGATPATVRVLLHQGRQALRAHLFAGELHDLVRDP